METYNVDEFLSMCNGKDIERLIDYLVDNGFVIRNEVVRGQRSERVSCPEQLFNTHLHSLIGKWNRLTTEEENMIVDISKRFV